MKRLILLLPALLIICSSSLKAVGPNDDCVNATVIDPGIDIPFDNTGANTDGGGDPLCNRGGNDTIFSDVWFSFTPNCNGNAMFTTVGGTSVDTKIGVYSSPCGSAIIACSDDSAGFLQSSITWAVTGGTTYLLRLGGFSIVHEDMGTFDLYMIEATPPTITCAGDTTVNTDAGLCTAAITPDPPLASDNCLTIMVTNDFNGTADATDVYPTGSTLITWTVTDVSNNTATCSHTVTINDNEDPAITCPPDTTKTNDANMCGANITMPGVSTSDNCVVSSVINDFNGTSSGTDFYPVGINVVEWTVTDNSGNTAVCTHTVTVTDDEDPTITCPADVVIPNCDSTAVVPVPVNGDNCSVASLTNDFNGTGNASDVYPVGTTVVTWDISDVTGNSATCFMNVTRNVGPAAVVSPDPAEACVATDLILDGNPSPGSSGIALHKWTGPAVVPPTGNSVVTFNMGVAGTFGPITYTVTDSNGCTASDNISVTVFANPKADIVPDVIKLCEGAVRVINGNPSLGNPPYSHIWTGNTAPISNHLIPSPAFTASSAGTYNLTYTVTDSKGCQGDDDVTVIVSTNPTVDITPDPATVCQNSPLILNGNLVPGSGTVITRKWTGATTKLSSTTSVTPTFNTNTTGSFNLIFTVTDNNSCSATDNITVTVNPLPVVSFSGLTLAQCENDEADTLFGSPTGGTFNGAGTGGYPVISEYTGVPDTIISNVNNISSHTVTVPGTVLGSDIVLKKVCFSAEHSYLSDLDFIIESPGGGVVYAGTNLCNELDDIDVCIVPGTLNSIDLAVCSATPPAVSGTYNASNGYDLDDLNDGTDPNGVWTLTIPDYFFPDDGNLLSWSLEFEVTGVNAFNPASAGPGNHTVTYTFTDGNSCTNSSSQTAIVHPMPAVDAGADQDICIGESATLTATGATTYQWSTGVSTASINVMPVLTTAYSVTGTNTFGCLSDDEVEVAVHALPALSVGGLNATYCANDEPDTLNAMPPGGTFSGPGVQSFGTGPSTISYTGPPVFIPSEALTTDTLSVSGVSGSALGVDVVLQSICFEIDHTYVEDLDIVIESPSGLQVVLTIAPCAGDEDLDVCIVPGTGNSMDDALCSGTPPALSGTFTASSLFGDDLANINDGTTDPNGDWVFIVADNFAGDDGNIISWSLNFHSYGVTTFDPSIAGAGSHTVAYEFTDGNGCSNSDSMQTTVLALPTAFAKPDTGVCPGSSALLTATGGISYSWSTGAATDTTTASPLSTTTYTVTVTNADGCSDTDDITVTVHPDPVVDAGSDQTVCSLEITTLTATGGVSYQWSTGDSGASIDVAPGNTTIYNVTATDANGCTGTDLVTINTNPLPTAVPGPDQDLCIGDTTIITASGGILYNWSDGVITSLTGDRPASPIVTATYNVTVSDSNNCSNITSVLVTVHNLPAVSFSGLDVVYCDDNLPDTLAGSPPGGIFSGAGMVGDVFTPSLLSPGVYNIHYTFIDSFGCKAEDSSSTEIFPAPSVSFSGLMPSYCPDTVAHVLVGNPTGGVFKGPGISENTFVSFYAGPGTHNITYSILTQFGCTSFKTQSVIVHTPPTVSISGLDPTYCEESEPDTLTGVPSGGVFSGNEMQGAVFVPPLVDYGTPAVVHYAYYDSNNCLGAVSNVTTVFPTPEPVIINPGKLCLNQGPTQLQGSPAGGVFSGTGFNNNILFPSDAGTGALSVTYSYTDLRGCTGDTTRVVTIYDAPQATLIGVDAEYCVNDPLVVMDGTPAGGDYSGQGVVGYTFSPEIAGVSGPFPVTYKYTDVNGCSDVDTQIVEVLNAPFILISGLNSFYCIDDAPVSINALPVGGTLAGAGVSNGMFDPKLAGIGDHVITYDIDNPNGCTDIEVVFVKVGVCTRVSGVDLNGAVTIFPNPSTGKFRLEISTVLEEQAVLKVYNLTGQIIFNDSIEAGKNYTGEIDLSHLTAGVYYLKLSTQDNAVVKKLVVQR